MNILAFILAVVAAVIFFVDWSRTRALLPLGLGIATVAVIIQLVWEIKDVITV